LISPNIGKHFGLWWCQIFSVLLFTSKVYKLKVARISISGRWALRGIRRATMSDEVPEVLEKYEAKLQVSLTPSDAV
jgi:hypothetical protein